MPVVTLLPTDVLGVYIPIDLFIGGVWRAAPSAENFDIVEYLETKYYSLDMSPTRTTNEGVGR